jgi:hypothetical protein
MTAYMPSLSPCPGLVDLHGVVMADPDFLTMTRRGGQFEEDKEEEDEIENRGT